MKCFIQLQGILLALTTAFGVCASAHAQQKSWNEVVQAAEAEGNVIIYSSLIPGVVENLVKAFQQKHPKIKVQSVRNVESVLIPKIQQEQSTSAAGADLVALNLHDFIDEQQKGGQLVKPIGPSVSLYPANAIFRGVAPVITNYPMGLAYNSDLVKNPPRTYEDFLRPEFKGAVGVINAAASPSIPFWYDTLRKTMPGYWEKLAAQGVKLYPSTIPITQAVASGEVKVTIFATPGAVKALQEQGAPIKFVMPTAPQVFAVGYPLGILKNARNPNAAQVFADFLMSLEGQTILNGNGNGVSAIEGVPGALTGAKLFHFYDHGYTPQRIKDVTSEWERVFRR